MAEKQWGGRCARCAKYDLNDRDETFQTIIILDMRLNKIISICIVLACSALFGAQKAAAQDVALKTNLVNDALLSPNIGVEVGLAPKWTLDVSGGLNLWKIKEHRWKHAFLQPEARYWFCQRFSGHFVGVHALGGIYNFGKLGINMNFLGSDFRKLRHNRYQGWAAGAGVVYGYAWPVHKHWNIEAALGFGWLYTRFDSYPCQKCGTKLQDNKPHNYVGPTKLAVNVEYIF